VELDKISSVFYGLTVAEDSILWDSNEMGKDSPRAFLHALFWSLGQHCGVRGRSEHYNLQVEDFHRGGGGGGGRTGVVVLIQNSMISRTIEE
jgi:hypothetical protein